MRCVERYDIVTLVTKRVPFNALQSFRDSKTVLSPKIYDIIGIMHR